MRVGLSLGGLAMAGALCAAIGWTAPAIWLITAALVGFGLILLYGLARMFNH